MFDLKVRGSGYVTAETMQQLVERMGEIIADELQKRDAEIRKLQSELETERRLRLGMKPR